MGDFKPWQVLTRDTYTNRVPQVIIPKAIKRIDDEAFVGFI